MMLQNPFTGNEVPARGSVTENKIRSQEQRNLQKKQENEIADVRQWQFFGGGGLGEVRFGHVKIPCQELLRCLADEECRHFVLVSRCAPSRVVC